MSGVAPPVACSKPASVSGQRLLLADDVDSHNGFSTVVPFPLVGIDLAPLSSELDRTSVSRNVGGQQVMVVDVTDPTAPKVLSRTPGSAAQTPVGGFCSAHWFDYHQSGVIAQGWYQQGLRIIDVNDPRTIKQSGYFTAGASEVWDAYWVPARNADGTAKANREKTNIVYTADALRGIDVLEVSGLPPAVEPRKPTRQVTDPFLSPANPR